MFTFGLNCIFLVEIQQPRWYYFEYIFEKKALYILFSGTEAFHKFLNLISSCDSLLYSDYFYSFLTSEEHNEAVSHIKLGRYGEAVNLLETIFHIREKLLTATNIMVSVPTYLFKLYVINSLVNI